MTSPTPAPEVDPHEHDEDPEDHIGEEMPDPWTDDDQPDWPNGEVEV
jgi:hypothetical protein